MLRNPQPPLRPTVGAGLTRTLGLPCPPLWSHQPCMKFRRARRAGADSSWLCRSNSGSRTSEENPVFHYSVCGHEQSEPQRQSFHSAAAESGAAVQVFQGLSRLEAAGQLHGLTAAAWQLSTVQGLTIRSKGAPTAGHQARAAPWCILRLAGLMPCRCRPLSSNVRHHKIKPVASPAGSAARCAEDQTATARHSREQPSPLVHLLGNGQKRAVRCPQFMKQQLNFSPSKVGASRQSCCGPRSRVCHSVLRACRRTQRRSFVQLGLRRQASSWRVSLVSAERFAFASLHQNQS